jgi:hypothetical protein
MKLIKHSQLHGFARGARCGLCASNVCVKSETVPKSPWLGSVIFQPSVGMAWTRCTDSGGLNAGGLRQVRPFGRSSRPKCCLGPQGRDQKPFLHNESMWLSSSMTPNGWRGNESAFNRLACHR